VRFLLPSIIAVIGLVAAMQAGCASAHHNLPADLPALPPTPPMGWNSWDSSIKLTEQNVEATIDAMVASGMRDAGYRYVNLDAGWAAPVRGPHGQLQVDPTRFPDGMAAVARYAHDRGMLLGLYASPYNEGCSAQPALASVDHETLDANTFAAWGVDYLKYDWCRADADHDTQVRVFTKMRDALRDTGRRILYSINPNSSVDYTAGARYDWSGIADTTRVTTDLYPLWRDQMPSLGPFDPFPIGADLGVPDEFTAATQVVTPSHPGYARRRPRLGPMDRPPLHVNAQQPGVDVGVRRPTQKHAGATAQPVRRRATNALLAVGHDVGAADRGQRYPLHESTHSRHPHQPRRHRRRPGSEGGNRACARERPPRVREAAG